MKVKLFPMLICAILVTFAARGQGSFVYDQQSSTDETPNPYGSGSSMQALIPPWGQSFTPTLTSIGFVRLKLVGEASYTPGISMLINLRSDSISGAILGSTETVFMPNGFSGTKDFLFSTPVFLTPGVVYYFEPVVQSGSGWNIDAEGFNYARGTAWNNGIASSGSDLWFREGIVIPEPSTFVFALFGLLSSFRLINRHKMP